MLHNWNAGRELNEGAGKMTTADRIRNITEFLADEDGAFVSIRLVREALDNPADFDQEMTRLYSEQKLNMVPRSCQAILTAADRASAVLCGGEDKHLVSWG
jgi:hypothetical protein